VRGQIATEVAAARRNLRGDVRTIAAEVAKAVLGRAI